MLEIFQAGLQAKMLPKQHICTKNELVARIFGNQPSLREESWSEGNATYYSVPFGVVATKVIAVAQCHAQFVASESKMLGGRRIEIAKIQLDIGMAREVAGGQDIVAPDGYGRMVLAFLQRPEFHRSITVLAPIKDMSLRIFAIDSFPAN